MTKRDLIDEVVKQFPRFSRRDAEVMVNAVFDSMTTALCRGDRIEIRGFGTLCVKQARARLTARNPKTRETVRVPARRKVQFKPGQALREGLHQPSRTG